MYCPDCGQRRIDEINWSIVLQNIGDAFELKRGLLYNFKNFTFNSKTSITNYLNGKTRPFLNPVSYMFVGLGLFFVSVQLTEMFGENPMDEDLFKLAKIIVYSIATLFPLVFSLILYGSIIDKKPNYLKGIIVALFLSGHVLILLTITRGILFLFNLIFNIYNDFGLIVFLTVGFYFTIQFSRAYLMSKNVLLRLIASSAVVFITFLIFTTLLIGSQVTVLPEQNQAFELGKLLRGISDLLTGF